MNSICSICNRECEKKSYTSVGGQTVCSIKCAASVSPNLKDECSNCGSVVWEDENYNVNGELCCCSACRDEIRDKNKSKKKSSSKKNDYSTPSSKNSKKSSNKKNTYNYSNNDNYYQPRQNQFDISP